MSNSAWRLIVRDPDHMTRRFDVRKSVCLIGRSERCDLRLADPTTSNVHARLLLEDDDLVIEDLGSTNGVSTPSGELRAGMRCALRAGDVLGLGRTVIEVLGRQTDWISSDVFTSENATLSVQPDSPPPDSPPPEAPSPEAPSPGAAFPGAARETTAESDGWTDPGRSIATVLDTGILMQPPRGARRPRLTLLGPGTRETVDVTHSPFRVGRTPGPLVALVVRHDRLSSPHIELRDTGTGVEVVDLGSRNGTWVDGARLQENRPYPLGRHALLRMGKLAALFTAEADTAEDSAIWERAASVLIQEGILTHAEVERARAAATPQRNLGELLLVAPRSSLTVERWVHTTERARHDLAAAAGTAPVGKRRATWAHTQELMRAWWTKLARNGRRAD